MAFGSVHIPAGCTVKIGDTIPGLMDLGVLKGDASIGISYEMIKVLGSKAEQLLNGVHNMKAEAAFELYQLHLPNIKELLDGIVDVTPDAGVLVPGYTENIDANATVVSKFYQFEKQNGDGTIPTSIVITKLPATVLVLGTDYLVIESFPGSGIWGLVFIAGGDYDPTAAMTWEYDYTPNVSYTLVMGDKSATLVTKIVEFSKTIAGKVFRARLWSVTNEAGLTLAFPDSANDEPLSLPVTLVGGLDTAKAAGEQLIEIYDEIGLVFP
ncbi:MAG TPA: hypothetical protein VFI02_12940 [Armatimonadota bacterium]|nr:hypothetical protein [Armatimonadota bacterium]